MRMSKRADPHGLRSKHRSALRLCLGTAYYSARRYQKSYGPLALYLQMKMLY